MFEVSYNTEKGWHDAQIVHITTVLGSHHPFCTTHKVFEGLKAYRTDNDEYCCSALKIIAPA